MISSYSVRPLEKDIKDVIEALARKQIRANQQQEDDSKAAIFLIIISLHEIPFLRTIRYINKNLIKYLGISSSSA
ncbi:hypothetical protein ICM_05794 [Bacillus cereus BAG1X2-3]|uniref:Uncharacterized protein n=1 Tax=Bacillus cereus TaxID=1396 RepID=A0A9X7HLS8_BACCE|nr:hypothetical protein ICC_05472 [Bacillus cereus BAG1X1-1]EOO43408.1 hypothetical protein ICI_05754 [Bacillus cereus BAG1X2-1]EOO44775.1 hypothetical protein ICK_05950 [Bacillus cereus BAG1X2-2]EOO56176.1 hypothetical protein ICM_05794 [Bacillus cereus BAG1X2-3]EOP00740.1 hypothetical protein ICO_06045 [Bacillus cereus BAG2O-1]PHA12371.1 hypothetical protein COE70_29700 [Bacillus cereus]